MRYIITLVLLFNFVVSAEIDLYEPNERNFRDGFEAGLKMLSLQAKNDDFQQKIITINKPYLLVYDIKNIPLHEALFVQLITSREGFDTHFTKEFVTLGEFVREIDAKDAQDLLVRKYKLDSKNMKILTNQTEIVTYPFLFIDFHRVIIEELQRKGFTVKNEVIYVEKPTTQPKKEIKSQSKSKKEIIKKISFKNKRAMSYIKVDTDNNSINFIESKLVNATTYDFEEYVTTKEGEKFVKVKGKNIYFAFSDVSVK